MAQLSILQLKCVSRQFSQTDQPAVSEVSLSLAEGDLLGLLGPSGCGKTTLLRLIAGFERPQSGEIELDGQRVAGAGVWIAPERRSIGMVFQDFALFPHLTVAENIAFGLKQNHRQPHIRERVRESIALVDLKGLEKRYPHELSGGQQQRVALARALAPRPTLILLDEPLSNLDVQVRLYLRQEIRDILKATGTSGIFVTHDQEEAMAISDRVAVMRQGRIEQLGTPEEIYREPVSRFVAEFVTQANFLPARRQSGFWQTEVGQFAAVPNHCTCQADVDPCLVESRPGSLMIRQEDLVLHPHDDGEVVVRDRQFLGREYCYRLSTASGLTLNARTHTNTCLPIGARIRVSVANDALRFYPVVEPTRTPIAIRP